MGPPWASMGPVGAPNPARWVEQNFQSLTEINNLAFSVFKMILKTMRWNPVPNDPNGLNATHLVAKRCDLGSLEALGRARTPLGYLEAGCKF